MLRARVSMARRRRRFPVNRSGMEYHTFFTAGYAYERREVWAEDGGDEPEGEGEKEEGSDGWSNDDEEEEPPEQE